MFRMLLPLLFAMALFAKEPQNDFGIMAGFRAAEIPYNTNNSHDYMYSLVPWMWFEGSHFFMRANRYGLHLYHTDTFELNALAKIRYVDMPHSAEEYFSGDMLDSGINLHYMYKNWQLDMDLMQDGYMRSYIEANTLYGYKNGALELKPFLALYYRSQAFNTYYYGIDTNAVPALGIESTYALSSHVRLYLRLKSEYLGSEAKNAPKIERPLTHELITGLRLGSWSVQKRSGINDYMRIGFGLATKGSFSQLLTLSAPEDEYAHKMVSLFYGYPLWDEIFGNATALYLHSGVAFHAPSEVQNGALESVTSFKLFVDLPYDFRLGAATGISYITETTYVERWANGKDGYKESSKFMNHLDFSLEYRFSKKASAGYGIFHRSGVFESVQTYGQIKGGSNYHHFFIKAYM